MPESAVEGAVSKLIDSIPALLIVCGLALLTLGIVGGIVYHNWLPLSQTVPRVLIGVVGTIVFGLGVRMSVWSGGGIPRAAAYGITIVHPHNGDKVGSVDVRGTIKKAIPPGYSLRVFRLYPGKEHFVPLSQATLDLANQTWEALSCDIKGKSGERRQLGAYLVGPAGKILIECWREASQVHNEVSEELTKATGAPRVWLPPIPRITPDIIECARVSVTRE